MLQPAITCESAAIVWFGIINSSGKHKQKFKTTEEQGVLEASYKYGLHAECVEHIEDDKGFDIQRFKFTPYKVE